MVPFVFSTKTRRHEKECYESEQCEEMTERENEESTSDGKSDDSGERTGRNEVETAEEGGNDSKETEEMETAAGRTTKECPVLSCHKKVVHLPRHLRNVHKWSAAEARAAVVRFNLRKEYTFATEDSANSGNRKRKRVGGASKPKPCRRRKQCPLGGCAAVTDRLPQHMQRVHKLRRNDIIYRRALSTALMVLNEQHMFEKREKHVASPSSDSEIYSDDDNLDNPGSKHSEIHHETDTGINDDIEKDVLNLAGKILTQFKSWLLSPDGGMKDIKTAKQHAAQLTKILSVVDANNSLTALVDDKKIRNVFLGEYAKTKYNPATIKSYLMSLQHYCSFLLADQPQGVSFDKDAVIRLREKLKRWSTSYKRESTRRRWEKMEDVSALITPEHIHAFEQSTAARDAIILLGQLCGAHAIEITQAKYTLVRDYLLAQIMIDNANRAGVVAYMTIQEYERAKIHDDHYVVRVLKHKTVNTHGPAQLVLTKHLYSYLGVFIKEMRTQLPNMHSGTCSPPVFLSWSGNSMESSQMTKAIGSIFKKAGIDGPIHHTLYRKSAVSRCHDQHKDISSNLADLMAHREDTAQKYYRVFEKSKSSVKASQRLHGIMRNSGHGETVTCSEELPDTEQKNVCEMHATGEQSSCTKRSPWTEDAIEAVQSVFKEEIDAQKISIDTVREKIKLNPCLKKESPKRV